MDRLQAMGMFVRVAELGSFAAVARQLGVARSVVTRQVAALEKHLGAKLMIRTTRQLTLTSAGTAYLERCRVILNLVDAAETDIAEERAIARGRVRVGLPLSFGLKRLAPLLLEFAKAQPEVRLELDFTDRRLNLVEEGFDLAVRITSRLAPGDVVRRLASCRVLAVASPAYLARHGRPEHPLELAGHQCLAYTGDANPQAWGFKIQGRLETFPIASRLSAGNGEVLADAAAQGLGITRQPDFIADDYLADGRLVPVLEDFEPPALGVYAVLPGGLHVPYRVRILLEFLAGHLRRGTAPTSSVGPPSRKA